ncbi:aminotransferase class V-fold PLP-dependent enzyme [Halorubellus sp. JP-L1]|uniref:aminotransferase class V-fold PLP-dependent enzyme n=1 Tax=Halorubellus sp. JP-L1 TaxID=2715753 RepID=UPI0014087D22|nr:aminotransferase class V-fold PLP-dependent enzyme [Halorubellus sp. JP-L1]NHN42897.1 aminotransferase class V-fold PLP-dependent enzyme [Halorubellus sp. JP-L1]
MAVSVSDWRDEIPAISEYDRIHLNNCSASPLPERGREARRECERVWMEEPNPWETWLAKVNESKERFASLINADPSQIAVLSCATQALAQVASALDYDDRDEVVVSDLEFPTVPQFWYAQERKRGARLRVAESEDGLRVSADAYADAMSDRTSLVCTAHAYSFTGGLMDPKAVADEVHDRGGYLFLDAYQSIGVVPIDVEEQDIDMLTAGTLKFLMGGPGIAFLYVDDDVAAELEPANMGWFSVDDIFGFETEEPEYAPGARRFEMGTPPAPNAYQASAGMSIIQEVGTETIRERVLERTAQLIEGAIDRGFSVRTPLKDAHRGGVVNVQVQSPETAAQRLMDDGICISTRAGGVRFSPHFYTTEADVDTALDALAEHATPP